MYRKLVFGALCLTLVVVVVGAYVRLQEAAECASALCAFLRVLQRGW